MTRAPRRLHAPSVAVLGVLGLLAAGCPNEIQSRKVSADPGRPVSPTAPASAAAVAPAASAPEHSVDIVVRNGTARAIELDVTESAAAYLRVVDEQGVHPLLQLDAPAHCECLCAQMKSCPECAKPIPKAVTVPPGEKHVFAWNGMVRRYGARHDGCQDQQPPPPGRYLVQACGRDAAGCATIEVTLPATGPLVLELTGTRERATQCPLGDHTLVRAGRIWAAHMQLQSRGDADRWASCDPAAARCVSAQDVPAAPRQGCTLIAIPRGEQIEVRALVPPRADEAKSYSVYLDARAVQIERVDWSY